MISLNVLDVEVTEKAVLYKLRPDYSQTADTGSDEIIVHSRSDLR